MIRNLSGMKLKITNPDVQRHMAILDACNIDKDVSSGVHSKVIKGKNDYIANQNLNNFYNKMNKYPTFEILNVVSNTVMTGIVYTVTYKI